MPSSLEKKAAQFARNAHAQIDQRRKYTGQPYIVHPQAVAELVRHVSEDDNLLAAAWLHDTLEDTATTFRQLYRSFGKEVAQLVSMLTNPPAREQDGRLKRKQRQLQHYLHASPQAQTIKLADIIDNTRDVVDNDPDFARHYLVEKQIQIFLLRDGDPQLWALAEARIRQQITRLCQPPYNQSAAGFRQLTEQYLTAQLRDCLPTRHYYVEK